MALEVNGLRLPLTDQGFLVDQYLWDDDVALALAQLENITLQPAHWEILYFIREYYQQYKHLPNTRGFVKAVRNTLGETKGCSRYLQQLFSDGFLKIACKLAGLPKPPTCL
ncbi:MAG: TusE/DsrC/DsvC family sulfur relay protein [Methylococcaceae bacterium]|nr:TusE/DsrC/DsvC family sulfur relay protein [Methylococcaceae bacterium]